MTGPGPVTRALMGMVRATDEHELAGQICRACVDGLDVDGAAISLLTGTASRVTLAATDPVAQMLEDLQFTLNEGACMEAATTGRPVLVSDMRDSSRTTAWPSFASEVGTRSSVSALFAWPLQWGAVNLGVLDLYRLTPGPLGDEQWDDLAIAAGTAALLILGHRTDPLLRGADPDDDGRVGNDGNDVDGTTAWLDEVSSYHAEIHQATGMVQVQLGVPGVDALARMRGHAFAHHQLLTEVARDVVERRLVFTEQML